MWFYSFDLLKFNDFQVHYLLLTAKERDKLRGTVTKIFKKVKWRLGLDYGSQFLFLYHVIAKSSKRLNVGRSVFCGSCIIR